MVVSVSVAMAIDLFESSVVSFAAPLPFHYKIIMGATGGKILKVYSIRKTLSFVSLARTQDL